MIYTSMKRISRRTQLRLLLEKIKRIKRMETVHIHDSNEKLTENFAMSEFYKTQFGCHGEFDMPICLYKAMQVIRDYYSDKYGKDIPFTVTSVFRPDDSFGEHRIGSACDSVASDVNMRGQILQDIHSEFKTWKNSELVKGILSTGTNVLIIEGNCLHLGYRTFKLSSHPEYTPSEFYIGYWSPNPKPYGSNVGYS